jgi:hypothetical protein
MSEKADAERDARREVPRRRPYRTPRLERLGTLQEITANAGTLNKTDHAGAHAPLTKTS